MDKALEVARFEGACIYGLHIVENSNVKESEQVKGIEAEFMRRCQEGGVSGELSVEVGKIAARILFHCEDYEGNAVNSATAAGSIAF